jgi:hypothetical protein
MTSKERIITAFELDIPDKVPVSPRLDTLWLNNAGSELTKEIICKTDFIVNVDLLPDYVQYFGEQARSRCTIRTEGGRRYEKIDTPKGELTRIMRVYAGMMDWAEKHFFETPDDVDKALSIPFEMPELHFTEYRQWVDRVGDDGIVLGYIPDALCCPGLWFSPEEFIINTCALHTDLIRALLEKVSANILAMARSCLEQGVRYILIAGAELASQSLMGPEWFSKLVVTYDGSLIELIRQHGGYVWYHCHSKIRQIHKEIASMRPHLLSPCEKPPQGDIELKKLKESIGDRVCLAGNLDDEALLATGNRELIRERAQECLEAAMPGGGYILGGTEGCIFSRENAEAYLYLCELRDEYGVY